MTAWTDRVALARSAWSTEIRLDRTGFTPRTPTSVSAGVWARTHYWNGWITDICLHDHLILDLADDDAHAQLTALVGNVREVCERAARDFPDQIPCLGDGNDAQGRLKLAVNSWEMRDIAHRPDGFYPTEAIAPGVESQKLPATEDHLARLATAAAAGLHVEDSINPHFGPARYARDCKDRNWGYRLRLAKKQIGEVPVAFRPRALTLESLHEQMICQTITAMHFAVDDLFAAYAPGGAHAGKTCNGLPPGEKTRQEYLEEQEARQAAVRSEH